jgi:hypothetical protein
MMEGCSVCTCDESEIPSAWIEQSIEYSALQPETSPLEIEYGWISPRENRFDNGQNLYKLENLNLSRTNKNKEYFKYLRSSEANSHTG